MGTLFCWITFWWWHPHNFSVLGRKQKIFDGLFDRSWSAFVLVENSVDNTSVAFGPIPPTQKIILEVIGRSHTPKWLGNMLLTALKMSNIKCKLLQRWCYTQTILRDKHFFKRSGFIILIQLWVQLSFCAAARKNCKNVDTICRTLFGSHVGAPQSACWSWHEWTRATTDLAFFHSYRRASSGYMGMESVTIMKLQNVF